MKRCLSLVLMLAVLLLAVPAAPAAANGPVLPPNCVGSLQPDLETYVICIPTLWNHDLIVFAHGFEFAYPVTPTPKLGEEQWIVQLSSGTTSLPELVNAMGYAFAATSYSKNGLAVQEGVTEMKELVDAVRLANPTVRDVYIIGASEGGLITTLSLERNPDVYKGGLALCGPIGDFQKQVNYWGDFRTAFDMYFPATLPADAVNIPDALMADWVATPSLTQLDIIDKLSNPANANTVLQLIGLTQAPYDMNDVNTIGVTTIGILTYNVLATNEARVKLGVQPYDNTANTTLRGLGGMHYTADPGTAAAILPYQTTGILTKPLVTMHNLGDPIVPVWHEAIYQAKINMNSSGSKFTALPVNSYGHCAFKPSEMLFGFAMMLYKSNQLPVDLTPFLAMLSTDAAELANFQALNNQYGNLSKVKIYLPVTRRQ